YARRITIPTLLIVGAIDDIAPLSAQYGLRGQLPTASLVIINNVGHLIHHEAPDQAAATIEKFLSKKGADF
ncbi:MAG TPA: alpha/beta hydrolase, partial [Candidatus Saccharimonadales bacterium]|nr:alpha/beta hydrolase [Candidatus Saccharimonadales bacterium]